jgi:hypothetical protein
VRAGEYVGGAESNAGVRIFEQTHEALERLETHLQETPPFEDLTQGAELVEVGETELLEIVGGDAGLLVLELGGGIGPGLALGERPGGPDQQPAESGRK